MIDSLLRYQVSNPIIDWFLRGLYLSTYIPPMIKVLFLLGVIFGLYWAFRQYRLGVLAKKRLFVLGSIVLIFILPIFMVMATETMIVMTSGEDSFETITDGVTPGPPYSRMSLRRDLKKGLSRRELYRLASDVWDEVTVGVKADASIGLFGAGSSDTLYVFVNVGYSDSIDVRSVSRAFAGTFREQNDSDMFRFIHVVWEQEDWDKNIAFEL